MFWSAETPTVPGLYWLKADDYDVTIVELTDQGEMIIRLHPRPMRLPVEKFLSRFHTRQWLGPLRTTISHV